MKLITKGLEGGDTNTIDYIVEVDCNDNCCNWFTNELAISSDPTILPNAC